MKLFKILAAFLVVATVGIIGCGEEKDASSGTEGQYADPGAMMGESEMPEEPAEEGGETEAPAEEATTEEAAEEAPAEEAAEEAPAEEAAEEAPAEEAAEESAEGEG